MTTGIRRAALAAVVAIASLGAAGLVTWVSATPSAASPPACTDTWVGPTTGTTNWNASTSDWNTGAFPGGSDVVCITSSGTYTVDLPVSVSINTLELGGGASGTQTLQVDGANVILDMASASTVDNNGVLSLSPAGAYADINGTGGLTVASGGVLSTSGGSGSQPAYIETPVTNQSGGTVTIGAPDTRQDSGTLTTNSGTFTVTSAGNLALTAGSSFTDSAGTLTVTGVLSDNGTFTQSGGTESGNPVTIGGGSLIDSAGTGAFDVVAGTTLSGTIPSGQTVTVDGSSTNVILAMPHPVIDAGTLILKPAGAYADINGTGGLTVASGGVLSTSGGSGSQPAYIDTPVTNQSGGTVTIGAPDTRQDSGTLTTNSGTFTVTSAGNLALTAGSSFTDSAGTLTVTGVLSDNGTFTQSGGTESGNPVTIGGGSLIDSAGTGAFDVVAGTTLSGTIPSGQTVTVDGSSTNVILAMPHPVIDAGTLILKPAGAYADINGAGGLTVASGGVLSTSGGSGSQPAYIDTPVTNQSGGTVTIGAPDTRQDSGTLTTNSGTFSVTSAGNLALTAGSSFTDSAGTLTVTGVLSDNGTFTQSGGTESGNPVTIGGGSLIDSAGTGAFDVVAGTTLSGTIPSGQTVTVDGSSTNVHLAMPHRGHRRRDPYPETCWRLRRHQWRRRSYGRLGWCALDVGWIWFPTGLHRDPGDQPVRRHRDHRGTRHSSGLGHPDHQQRDLHRDQCWEPGPDRRQLIHRQRRHPDGHRRP